MNKDELRKLLDKDLIDLQFKKGKRFEERDEPYKYGDDNHQEVVDGKIPEWAKNALTDHKPGDVVGQYQQIHRKQITKDMV